MKLPTPNQDGLVQYLEEQYGENGKVGRVGECVVARADPDADALHSHGPTNRFGYVLGSVEWESRRLTFHPVTSFMVDVTEEE